MSTCTYIHTYAIFTHYRNLFNRYESMDIGICCLLVYILWMYVQYGLHDVVGCCWYTWWVQFDPSAGTLAHDDSRSLVPLTRSAWIGAAAALAGPAPIMKLRTLNI